MKRFLVSQTVTSTVETWVLMADDATEDDATEFVVHGQGTGIKVMSEDNERDSDDAEVLSVRFSNESLVGDNYVLYDDASTIASAYQLAELLAQVEQMDDPMVEVRYIDGCQMGYVLHKGTVVASFGAPEDWADSIDNVSKWLDAYDNGEVS